MNIPPADAITANEIRSFYKLFDRIFDFYPRLVTFADKLDNKALSTELHAAFGHLSAANDAWHDVQFYPETQISKG